MKINIPSTKEVKISDDLLGKIKEKLKTMPNPEVYWDYRYRIGDDQILKILTEKDGILDVENEIFDDNLVDYAYDLEIDGSVSV